MIRVEILSYLKHLSEIYESYRNAPILEIAICGGTALNLAGFLERPTKDVDVLSPEIWPEPFEEAAAATALRFHLKKDWINPGPVDLLRMGLPKDYFARCEKLQFHKKLKYLITSRFDQIHFKLYASVDRHGYHVSDLKALCPTSDELEAAARWSMTHDVSEGFKSVLLSFLKSQGWLDVAQRLEN